LYIENIVPTETFTSMLDDPSSGSIKTTYLLLLDLSKLLIEIKSSSSSLAIPQTIFLFLNALIKISFA
jgi:hypothetical protein